MNGCLPLAGVFAEEMVTSPCERPQDSRTGRKGHSSPAEASYQPSTLTREPWPQPRLYDGDMLEIFTSSGRRLVGSPDVIVSLAGGPARRLADLRPECDRVITCCGPDEVLCKIGHRYRGTAYVLVAGPPPSPNPASPPTAWISGLLVEGKSSVPREGGGGGFRKADRAAAPPGDQIPGREEEPIK